MPDVTLRDRIEQAIFDAMDQGDDAGALTSAYWSPWDREDEPDGHLTASVDGHLDMTVLADAVLAVLPRRWGVIDSSDPDGQIEVHYTEDEARHDASLMDRTVVSWIETEPEEVPDAGA